MIANLCGEIPLDMSLHTDKPGIRISYLGDCSYTNRQSMVWGNEVGPGLAERIRILVGE